MNDRLSPEQLAELRDLIFALHDQTISPEDGARLEEWICRDEDARRVYIQYMHLHARLYWDERQEPEPDGALPPAAPRTAQSPVLGLLADVFHAGTTFLTRGLVVSLLLTIGLPVLLLVVLLSHEARQPVPPAPPGPVAEAPRVAPVAVAKVTRAYRCAWGEGTKPLSVGAALAAHQRLILREGLLEITAADGAKVILQGPATFDVRGRNGGLLRQGSLVATVPEAAHGFTIQTPLATVVDLGTEFGVSVDPNGTCEAHVFDGRIEVGTRRSPNDAKEDFAVLSVGEATKVELEANGNIQTKPITLAPRQFVRRLPPATTAGLPEPTVLFSHEGRRDPTTEGWQHFNQMNNPIPLQNVSVSPTPESETPAWRIIDRTELIGVHYRRKDISPDLVARGQSKGWVMRTRVKVLGFSPPGQALAFFSYWPDKRNWVLRFAVDETGNQRLILPGTCSLGKDATVTVPNSRDAYVDYEVRYYPRTDDADVYINGKLAATGYYMARPFMRLLHFGTFREHECEAWFARVEWGILP